MMARPDETNEEILARALLIMQAAVQSRDEEIARLQPKADYADEVLDSVSCITTTQLAKELGMVITEMYLVWTESGREFIHQLLNPKFAN